MTKIKWIIGFAAVALLAGCSTKLIYEDKYDYDVGWRKGTVMDVGAGPKFSKMFLGDHASVSDDAIKNKTFAIIRYLKNYSIKDVARQITGEYQPEIGDKVYVHTKDSNSPFFPRTEKESSFLPFTLP